MLVTDAIKVLTLSFLITTSAPSAAQGMDALPEPVTKGPVDIEAIAQGYSKIGAEKARRALDEGASLLVFVSLDMPQATLERLLDQGARAQARILIRGFKNGSLRETVAHIQARFSHQKPAFHVDPQAFDRYAITRVPAFVLARAGENTCTGGVCAAPGDSVKVAGDVSLEYALEKMGRASTLFRADAARFISRLKQ